MMPEFREKIDGDRAKIKTIRSAPTHCDRLCAQCVLATRCELVDLGRTAGAIEKNADYVSATTRVSTAKTNRASTASSARDPSTPATPILSSRYCRGSRIRERCCSVSYVFPLIRLARFRPAAAGDGSRSIFGRAMFFGSSGIASRGKNSRWPAIRAVCSTCRHPNSRPRQLLLIYPDCHRSHQVAAVRSALSHDRNVGAYAPADVAPGIDRCRENIEAVERLA